MLLHDAYVHIAQRSRCLLDDDDDRITQQQLYAYAIFVERILASTRIRILRSTIRTNTRHRRLLRNAFFSPCAQPSSTWDAASIGVALLLYMRGMYAGTHR